MSTPLEQQTSSVVRVHEPSDINETDSVETATWRGRCCTKVRDKRNIPIVLLLGLVVGVGFIIGDRGAYTAPEKVFDEYNWCCVPPPTPYENTPAEGACWTGESAVDCSQVGIPEDQAENATSTTITTCVENCDESFHFTPLGWVGLSLVWVSGVGLAIARA